MSEKFEPKIICFFCKWCTSAGADLAGTSRMEYKPNILNIKVNCSSRVDPQHILLAFKRGTDGVLVSGCHPGDCHYQNGNYKTFRKISLLKKVIKEFGIDEKRLRLECISASEGKKFVEVTNEFTEQIRSIGPLKLS